MKKLFLKISQNPQESACARVLSLVAYLRSAALIKSKLLHRCFPVNFAKSLRAHVFKEHR